MINRAKDMITYLPNPAKEADLEARLAAANQANRILLETLSHDLRTPLNSIIGFADMMEQGIFGPVENKRYRNYISDICGSGRQMLEILNDVLERQRFEQIEKSVEDFRHMFELAPDLIGICRDGQILRINPAGANLLGTWPADALIGRAFADFVHADFKMLISDGLEKLTDRTTRLPLKLCRPGGGEVDVELAAIPYDHPDTSEPGDDSEAGAVMLIARDVTERNRAISRVAASEDHVRNIMNTVVEGIITIEDDGTIETVNPAAEKIFDYEPGELIGNNIELLIAGEQPLIETALAGDPTAPEVSTALAKPRELMGIRKDGSTVSIELTMSQLKRHGNVTFICALHDITERKMVEARLVELATRDPLTNLPNRVAFKELVSQTIEIARRKSNSFTILFVDLDNFRHINDTRGHRIGDEVIRMTGQRLRHCLRDCDTIAHQGGDEFLVILDGVAGDEEAQAAAHIIM